MVTLDPPHMVINSADFGGKTGYQMWNTWNGVDNKTWRATIIRKVATVARSAPGGKLKNLVLNSHGSPGRIHLGVGFSLYNVKMFADWAGLVEKIWIVACEVATVRRVGTKTDGNAFCMAFAKAAKAYIVASTNEQIAINKIYPYGKIDGFEGLALCYAPSGKVSWSHNYGPNWNGE